MKAEQARLAGEIRRWFEEAERADEREDGEHGRTRRGDELPEWEANPDPAIMRERKRVRARRMGPRAARGARSIAHALCEHGEGDEGPRWRAITGGEAGLRRGLLPDQG